MVSKEDFNKVWKDSSRENILNQFYYEHNELFRIKKEIREYIEENKEETTFRFTEEGSYNAQLLDLLDILDKGK